MLVRKIQYQLFKLNCYFFLRVILAYPLQFYHAPVIKFSCEFFHRAYFMLKVINGFIINFFFVKFRVGSWVFYKTLPLLFTSMSIPQGQIEMLRKAAATGLPLIFLPLHRSHLDYIAVTFTLCNSGIRAPLVAAGENLRIPIFG